MTHLATNRTKPILSWVAGQLKTAAGHLLRRETAKHEKQAVVYRGDPATCNACPLKASCTESDRGRIVHRSFYAEYLERVRGYHATAAYRKAMRKRQVWVEPLFAEAKEWHGLRCFRLRGLDNCPNRPTARITA